MQRAIQTRIFGGALVLIRRVALGRRRRCCGARTLPPRRRLGLPFSLGRWRRLLLPVTILAPVIVVLGAEISTRLRRLLLLLREHRHFAPQAELSNLVDVLGSIVLRSTLLVGRARVLRREQGVAEREVSFGVREGVRRENIHESSEGGSGPCRPSEICATKGEPPISTSLRREERRRSSSLRPSIGRRSSQLTRIAFQCC